MGKQIEMKLKYTCENSLYELCFNEVDKPSTMCDNCCEDAYESYLESYYGGSTPITLTEQLNEARKQKEKLR